MSNPWLERSKKNLHKFSVEKNNFVKAVDEWIFSGYTKDYGECIEVCQLCEQENLRYHFGIRNENTDKDLLVGSQCIDKFNIQVIDENGNEVIEKKVRYLQRRLKDEYVRMKINSLVDLDSRAKVKGNALVDYDKYCKKQYDENKRVSPRMLNYIFLRLEKEGIDFEPKHFTINLQTKKNRDEFFGYRDEQFERVKRALSKKLIEKFNEKRTKVGN